MAQPATAARRQSGPQQAVNLVTPVKGQSVSQKSSRGRPSTAAPPQASASGKSRDDPLWKTDEEALFIKLLGENNVARNNNQGTMLKGEQRFMKFALKINQEFHKKDPSRYIEKTPQQMKNKEHNLKEQCKKILKKVFKASLAKTVTGAATGPDGEIIREGDDGPITLQDRFSSRDEVGEEEVDMGDEMWANFGLYWKLFQTDDTLLCPNTREAGDGRKYSSRHDTGFDSDLDNDLEDDGESPPAKKKKTPGQSRVASKDHQVSTMLHHFREESAQNRRDAEEERAHHRAMEERRLADKAADRAQLNDLMRMLVAVAGGGGAVQAGVGAAVQPQPLFPQSSSGHPPAAAMYNPTAAPRPAPYSQAALFQGAPIRPPAFRPPMAPVLQPTVPQPSPAVPPPQVAPDAATCRLPVAPPPAAAAAVDVTAPAKAPASGLTEVSAAGSQASAATAARGKAAQPVMGSRLASQREKRQPVNMSSYVP